MADVKLKNIIKRYGSTEVIHGVNLDIKHGEFVVFVGPSGCGKSTLLRLIAGLEEITDGQLEIDNDIVNNKDPAERGIAMVFQSYALYPHLTVKENMGFGMKHTGTPKAMIKERVDYAAKALQLDHLMDRKPKDMSGGQRQRVAIGRAIVRDPKVFLFDEPLSNLDAELRVEMRLEISNLHDKLGNTMIYVTHDQVEAMTMADKIVVLRDGNIEQVGSPLDLYNYPVNMFVAGFIGSPKMNFMPVHVLDINENGITVNLPYGQVVLLPFDGRDILKGDKLTLGIRPEHIASNSDHEITQLVKVDAIECLGSTTYLYGHAKDRKIIVQVEGILTEAHKGSDTVVSFDIANVHLFTSDEQALKHI